MIFRFRALQILSGEVITVPPTISDLGSRGIIGEFYNTLEQDIGGTWVPSITSLFESNQESETYRWLGMTPSMREWIGGRQAKGFSVQGITIANKTFEATLEILLDDMRRDKTGQIMNRIRELATRANAHWAKLLTALLIAGPTSICYDGAFFFDTVHLLDSGPAGNQSNKLSPTKAGALPTAGEMETAILQAVQAMAGFVDDQGEPINENAKSFLVMVGPQLFNSAAAALKNPIIIDGGTSRTNTIVNVGGYSFELAVNARLLSEGNKFYTFLTDSNTRALIRQEEVPITVDAVAEGSELEFKERKHWYGVTALRNVGYGYWQRATQSLFV
jgi:phage major head subunit gpT-like protein